MPLRLLGGRDGARPRWQVHDLDNSSIGVRGAKRPTRQKNIMPDGS